jgi:hypothetical protein
MRYGCWFVLFVVATVILMLILAAQSNVGLGELAFAQVLLAAAGGTSIATWLLKRLLPRDEQGDK